MRPSRRETASRRLGILRVSRSPSETGPSNRTSQFCARNGQTAVADLNSLECCSLITCEEWAIAGYASGAAEHTQSTDRRGEQSFEPHEAATNASSPRKRNMQILRW